MLLLEGKHEYFVLIGIVHCVINLILTMEDYRTPKYEVEDGAQEELSAEENALRRALKAFDNELATIHNIRDKILQQLKALEQH